MNRTCVLGIATITRWTDAGNTGCNPPYKTHSIVICRLKRPLKLVDCSEREQNTTVYRKIDARWNPI